MILLDTHVLVWVVMRPAQLSRAAARTIRRAQTSGGCAIASITLWEMALLFERGRIRGSGAVESFVREVVASSAVNVLEITPDVASLAVQFPDSYPHDPADRLIGATARAHGLTLVTQDERIRESPLLRTVW